MFAKLTIVQKIAYGFAAMLVLIIGGVSVTSLGVSSIATQFDGLIVQDVAAVRHISNAKIALLEARRPEKDLLYADDPTLVDTSKSSIGVMLEQAALTVKVGQVIGDTALLEKAQLILAQAQDYQKAFVAMAAANIGQPRMIATLGVRLVRNTLRPRDHLPR